MRGELPFALAEYRLLYFRGVSRNRPSLLKKVLHSGGVATRMVSCVEFTEGGLLEVAANTKVCERIIAHMCSLKGVEWAGDFSPVDLGDAAQAARDLASLAKRTAWMASEANPNLPARRLGRFIGRTTVGGASEALRKILFWRQGPAGLAGQAA